MRERALVIGGGPAGGSLAAHLARNGCRVTVLERSVGPHDKVCGEFVSEEASRCLGDLGIDLSVLGAIRISTVRIYKGTGSVAVELPFRAYSLSRRVLDEAILHSAVSFGADLRRGAYVKSLEQRGSNWLVGVKGGESLSGSSVFLATGKHDLRGWKRSTSDRRGFIGLKIHLRLADDQIRQLSSCVELFLFHGGYAGLALVENNVANLCLVATKATFARLGGWDPLLRHLRETPVLARRLSEARTNSIRPLAISAIPYGHLQSRSDGPWRLGDQAAVIPSFCGEGIAIALRSAALAATHYVKGESAEIFQQSFAREIRGQIAGATLLSALLVRPWGQTAAMSLAAIAPIVVRKIALASRVGSRVA
jgi:menaquinone-9 beta-reductase